MFPQIPQNSNLVLKYEIGLFSHTTETLSALLILLLAREEILMSRPAKCLRECLRNMSGCIRMYPTFSKTHKGDRRATCLVRSCTSNTLKNHVEHVLQCALQTDLTVQHAVQPLQLVDDDPRNVQPPVIPARGHSATSVRTTSP